MNGAGMDIRQVELFVIAAEEQHFTRAAKRANIVQSGLSVAIRSLEEELGTLLFVRSTRRVDLSEAGRIFLPEARRILAATRSARDAVAAIKGGLSGRLSIGTVQSLSAFLDLPLLLQTFRERHPQIEILVREGDPESLTGALREGNLDLVFLPLHGLVLTGLSVRRLFSSPMVLATSTSHRLADRDAIKLSEVADEAFIDFSPRWSTRNVVDQIFLLEGVGRRTAIELENFDLLYEFVARGFGLAVVPLATIVGRQLHAMAITPTRSEESLPPWELGMLRAKSSASLSANPPADMFRALVEEVVRSLGNNLPD
jgi:DNA-binding transcriptional LysR family regulator